MKSRTYLHLMGKAQARSLETGVLEVIHAIDADIFHGSSASLRRRIIDGIKTKGWSSKIKLAANSNINITSIKGKTALCLQTGNMGRFYADLLKLQFLYQKRRIECGIYVLPTLDLARKMGSNLANFERLSLELNLFADVITVPILVIGIY